jgi:hypothetical protein
MELMQESSILPTGRDKIADREEVLAIIDSLTTSDSSWLGGGFGTTESLARDYWEELSLFQNNKHHMEGWLYNHIILMLEALKQQPEYDTLDTESITILEQAIMWSDLGKLATYKEKDDGTATAFGHDKASATLYLSATDHNVGPHRPLFHKAILEIIIEHMNGHKLSEMDEQGKTTIPDFLAPQVEGLAPWNWPEWGDLDIPHGESMGKKPYAWIRCGANKLLRIKQKCDEAGRISDLSFC